MRASTVLSAVASLTLVTGAAIGVRPVDRAPVPPTATAAHRASPEHRAEVGRIRAHFDSVLAELDARDVGTLDAGRRSRRAALVATLRAYRDRGVFPHNHDFGRTPTPYFVDPETGVRCAVAHLLEASGRGDVVRRVAERDNNVWVPQLAGDSAFTGWLDESGLTLAEAARIQVPYVEEPPPASPSRGGSLSAASAASLGGALAASYLNLRANAPGGRRLGTALGLAAGATAIGLGSAGLAEGRVSPALGAANVAVGAASAWLATRGLLRHRRLAAERREATQRRTVDEAPRATVSPMLPVGGEGAGVAVSVRF